MLELPHAGVALVSGATAAPNGHTVTCAASMASMERIQNRLDAGETMDAIYWTAAG